jgi:hypothetical protein
MVRNAMPINLADPTPQALDDDGAAALLAMRALEFAGTSSTGHPSTVLRIHY